MTYTSQAGLHAGRGAGTFGGRGGDSCQIFDVGGLFTKMSFVGIRGRVQDVSARVLMTEGKGDRRYFCTRVVMTEVIWFKYNHADVSCAQQDCNR